MSVNLPESCDPGFPKTPETSVPEATVPVMVIVTVRAIARSDRIIESASRGRAAVLGELIRA
jgi:hypothetical protein